MEAISVTRSQISLMLHKFMTRCRLCAGLRMPIRRGWHEQIAWLCTPERFSPSGGVEAELPDPLLDGRCLSAWIEVGAEAEMASH
jgi:hypothetical protein